MSLVKVGTDCSDTHVAHGTVNLPWQCVINADLERTGTKNSS